MALPINIDDLIRHRRVESARIEYKKDWNPERVLHSVCAFANDIDLAEGRNTGMPAIIRACEWNGSPLPRFETDEDRRQLRVVLPIHSAFLKGYEAPNGENNPFAVQKPHNTTEKTTERTTEKGAAGTIQETATIQETKQETTQEMTDMLLGLIRSNPSITTERMAEKLGMTRAGINYYLKPMKDSGLLHHEGPTKKGRWVIDTEALK